MSTTSERLFSYGTLQLRDVQISSFGRELSGTPDALPGWAISLVDVGDPEVIRTSGKTHHPIAVRSGNAADRVAGVVYELTPEELFAADGYEVSAYKRIRVTLASGSEAWAYVKA